MDDTGEGSRATRRQVLGATAGALAAGTLPRSGAAQQASGPTVYVGSGVLDSVDGGLYAVDAATGNTQWAFTQPSDIVNSSPTVADGTVYVGSRDDTLYAVDAVTGNTQWAFTQSSYLESSPTVLNGLVYIGSEDSNLYAVDADSGEEEWAFTQPFRAVRSSPAVASGTVYIGSSVGESNLYAVDATTGSEVWTFTQPSGGILSSPTVANGTVYVGSLDNTLYAVDTATGDQEWALTQSSSVWSSPTVVGGTVYVGSFDGTLYAVDVNSGEQEWTFVQPSDGIASSPTVADSTVYVGSQDSTLYAVDVHSGEQEWACTQPSAPVNSSPTVYEGTVYVGSDDATLYAVDAATGDREWAFTQPSQSIYSSPTVVTNPESGDSAGSRVLLGTLGHHGDRADRVTAVDPASFEVSIESVTGPPAGEKLEVTIAVENTGDTSGNQTVELSVPGLGNDSTTVSLGGGDSTIETLSTPTDAGDAGEYDVTVETDNSSASVDVTVREPAAFIVDIADTSNPVEGDSLNVTVDIENVGDTGGTQTVTLRIPGLGNDSTEMSLDGGDSATEILSVPTGMGDDGEYDATVETDTDSASESVTVLAPAALTVEITSTNNPVAGDLLEVSVTVENTGDIETTQTVELSAPGLGSNSTTVSLDGGGSTTEGFSLSTGDGDAGEYTLTVGAGDDSAERTVTVLAPAAFTVDITDVTDPVVGNPLTATVSVENTGNFSGEQTIELAAPGLGSDSTTISLDGGESTSETLSLSTGDGDAGEYTLTVDAGGDAATETVTITVPAGDDVSSNGGGGFGTTEMAVVGGGGGLALLFGAYALMHRSSGDDETEPDQVSPTSTESERSGPDTGTPTDQQSSDSDPEDTIDDLLEEVARTLDNAEGLSNNGRYDRALTRCEQAVATAQEAHTTARQRVSDYRVPEAETAVENATALRETIQAEQQAQQRILEELEQAEQKLDTAAAALDSESRDRASAYLDDANSALANASETFEGHNVPNLVDRLATLETRYERLQQATREMQTQTRVPTEIPDVTRRSLSYADIENCGELGRGGNADVSRATAVTGGGDIDIAVKKPRMGGGETLHTETVERMMQEAETWQQLDDHDHIVGVIDYGTQPIPWIGMEYMDGGHLGNRAGEMPLQQALWTAIVTTEAVHHAHRRGVAHLDLKPANILLRSVENGWDVPKVADWGLSKHLLNHSNSIEGLSPQYAAPEQFDDSYGSTDEITDVYQLGAVFYELFTGQPAFQGQPVQVINQTLSESPPAPGTVADVPSALEELLLTALEREKSARYESVLYLRDDLKELFDYS